MLDTIKAVALVAIKQIVDSVQELIDDFNQTNSSPIEINNLQVHPNPKTTNENLKMLDNPDLLSASLEDANIINNDFCSLTVSHTLGEALSLINLLSLQEIMIVDEQNKFVNILSSLSVLSEFCAPLKDIPFNYRIKKVKIAEIGEQIVNGGKQLIGELLSINRDLFTMQKKKQVRYALDELSKPAILRDGQNMIPILADDQTIFGVVSAKNLLEYLKDDRFLAEAKVKDLMDKVSSEKDFMEKPYSLKHYDTLDSAFYAINYLPVEHILICDRHKNLLGMVDRPQINALVHPLYHHLFNMPLQEIMKPVIPLDCIKPNDNLRDVINRFIKSDLDMAVVVNSENNQVPEMLITPRTILQFVK